MWIEDLKHDDIEKEFKSMEDKEIEKKSIESLKKVWEDITAKAKEISPESNENWAIDMVKAKYDLKTKEIEENFNKWLIGGKERDSQMQEVVNEFLSDINTITWTKEWSQAKQNKDFWDKKTKENIDYANKLEKFNKELVIKKEQQEAEKRLNKWKLVAQHEIWEKEEALQKLIENLEKWSWEKSPENK